jgi:hypothetical protein
MSACGTSTFTRRYYRDRPAIRRARAHRIAHMHQALRHDTGVRGRAPRCRPPLSHDCVAEVVNYAHLPRAIIEWRTDGLTKLIVDRQTCTVLGAHVLGSYSAEVIQVAAACMVAKMDVRQIAELELAFPTVTEAIGIAARRCVRDLGLEPPEWTGGFADAALMPQRPAATGNLSVPQ